MKRRAPLILDGGTGSALARRGLRSPQAWSGLAARDRPELLREIHREWLQAGADVLTTNTFAAARFVLEAAGCEDVRTVQKASLDLALEAVERSGRGVLLAGSLSNFPPSFSVAAYPGAGEELDAYRELAAVLSESVDVLLLEMIEDTVHAERLYRAAEETGLPLWVGVSLKAAAGGLRPYDFPQRPLDPVLDQVADWGVDLVSVMHTPVGDIEAGLRALEERGATAVGAYPEIEGQSPEDLVRAAESWSSRRGLRLVGGCCGSSPEHVRALRDWVDRRFAGE